MDNLVVCRECRRHVKAHDASCPFCRSAIPNKTRSNIAFVGGVAVGVGLSIAACGGQTAPNDGGTDAAIDYGNPLPAYGPAPWDGSVKVDSGSDAGADADGGMVVMYGPPPPQDAGSD